MIRWSPTKRVFSIEPVGITRACPRAPLTSMKTKPTQNQARISLLTLALMEAPESLAEEPLVPFLALTLIASAFTIHLSSLDGLVASLERNWSWRFFLDSGDAWGSPSSRLRKKQRPPRKTIRGAKFALRKAATTLGFMFYRYWFGCLS